LEFVRQKPVEQWDTLSKLVGLDFTALNQRRQKSYDDRTLVGRQLEQVRQSIGEHPFDDGAPVKEAESTELIAQLDAIQKHNHSNAEKRRQVEAGKAELRTLDQQSLALDTEIKAAELRLVQLQSKQRNISAAIAEKMDGLMDVEREVKALADRDETPVRRSIGDMQTVNAKVRANLRHMEIQTLIQKHQDEYDALTRAIEEIDEEKQGQLAFATFPLDGLSLGDTGVLLNGVPFGQGSQARQLQAAVAIGLALNPRLRVILIRDGSLLDDDSMKLVTELAVKHKAQIWIEVVQSKDPAAVVIEDGEVKHLDSLGSGVPKPK
jgi:hypothetical protein